MRIFKELSVLCLLSMILATSCVQKELTGTTVSSQVTGQYMSTNATIVSNNETLVDNSENYMMNIIEVDANTVSVITEYTQVFEVDLVKSENGELTTGTTSSAGSDFTFNYDVSEEVITVKYSKNNVTMDFTGVKE